MSVKKSSILLMIVVFCLSFGFTYCTYGKNVRVSILYESSNQPVIKIFHLPSSEVADFVHSKSKDPSFKFAFLDKKTNLIKTTAIPTAAITMPAAGLDPLTSQQWGLTRLDFEKLGFVKNLSTITVAVVDTGVDSSHEDLAGKVLKGYSTVNSGTATTDPNGHGTHVAGIIAALVNNKGGQGLAAGVNILPVQVLDSTGSGFDSDIARGVIWAADHGADVINMSLGDSDDTPALRNAVAYAESQNVVVVAAAGNSALDKNPVFYPAAYPGVIAVAAAGVMDSHAIFSETGSFVSLTAPGVGILSTWPGNNYKYESGTSMSSPFVAASAALVKAVHPSWTQSQVVSRLEASAQDIGAVGKDSVFGYGMVDPLAATTTGVPSPPNEFPSLPTTPSLPTAPSLPSVSLPKGPKPPSAAPLPVSPVLPVVVQPRLSSRYSVLLSPLQTITVYGSKVLLRTTVYSTSMKPISRAKVYLYNGSTTSKWTLAASGYTDATGSVVFGGSPGSTSYFKAVFSSATSLVLKAPVSYSLNLRPSSKSFTITSSPTATRYIVEKLNTNSWVVLYSTKNSSFNFSTPGLYRICVNATASLKGSCSNVISTN